MLRVITIVLLILCFSCDSQVSPKKLDVTNNKAASIPDEGPIDPPEETSTNYALNANFVQHQQQIINHLSIITLTHSKKNSDTDDRVEFSVWDSNNDKKVNPISLNTSRNDRERNRADRYEISLSTPLQLSDLHRFTLQLVGNDGWRIAGLIVIADYDNIIFSKTDLSIFLDNSASTNFYREDPENYQFGTKKKLGLNDVINKIQVITTNKDKKYSDTDDRVYIEFANFTGKYHMNISNFNDFERARTNIYTVSSANYPSRVGDITKVRLSKSGSDGVGINSVIVLINNKLAWAYTAGEMTRGFFMDNANGHYLFWEDNKYPNIRSNPQWDGYIY